MSLVRRVYIKERYGLLGLIYYICSRFMRCDITKQTHDHSPSYISLTNPDLSNASQVQQPFVDGKILVLFLSSQTGIWLTHSNPSAIQLNRVSIVIQILFL